MTKKFYRICTLSNGIHYYLYFFVFCIIELSQLGARSMVFKNILLLSALRKRFHTVIWCTYMCVHLYNWKKSFTKRYWLFLHIKHLLISYSIDGLWAIDGYICISKLPAKHTQWECGEPQPRKMPHRVVELLQTSLHWRCTLLLPGANLIFTLCGWHSLSLEACLVS